MCTGFDSIGVGPWVSAYRHGVHPFLSNLDSLPTEPPRGTHVRAAVLLPLYWDGSEIRLVFIKRPLHMKSHPGQIAFPGGRVDAEDMTAIDTALREAEEEVGIQPEEVEVIGVLDTVSVRQQDQWIVPVVGWLESEPVFRPNSWEVDKIHTPPLSHFTDDARWYKRDFAGHDIWYIEMDDNEVLWGASANMLRDMLDRL